MRWTPDQICASLRQASFSDTPDEVRDEPRDGRTLVRLPGDRLAWFAETPQGAGVLKAERRVLRLLQARCGFRAPRILFVAGDGSFDVRAAVPGWCEPWALFERAKRDAAFAARLGRQLGGILAEQHTRITAADAAAWLPRRPLWPEPTAWIRERIPRVTAERRLAREIDALLDCRDQLAVSDADRVLVHGDVGLHNIAVDTESFIVLGIFDYEGAAWADRHHDFQYLLFDAGRDDLLDAALAVYEPATGRRLSRERVALYNAVCAASFLAFRDGVPPDQPWCGRTLAQDLAWTRAAIARCGIASDR